MLSPRGVHAERDQQPLVVPLVIEDPICAEHNVGAGCFRFYSVQQAFGEALERIAQRAEFASIASLQQTVSDFY